MRALRHWWDTVVDYDWMLRYHRSTPVLRQAPLLISLLGVAFALVSVALVSTPDLVTGTPKRLVMSACGVLALLFAVVGRRVDTRRASVAFVVIADGGIATMLFSLTPSPFAIFATTSFAAIGHYAASFHGARVIVPHYAFMLGVFLVLVAAALGSGESPIARILSSAGITFIVLFTSSIMMECLVSHLRYDAARAHFDTLTGVRNRRGLLSAWAEIHREHASHASGFWCMIVDLDHFKSINDQFGHDHGDDVLRRTASRIDGVCSWPTVAARVGGEEFAIVGAGTEQHATEIANRVLSALHDPGDVTPVTASLGVAVVRADELPVLTDASLAWITDRADAAMYEAKRRGGNQVILAASVCADDDPVTGG